MAEGSWKKSDVRCPFYLHDVWKERKIHCEGIFVRSRIISTFRRRADYFRQMELYCCGENWEKCEIARAILEAKYPEE